jgi:hypothetical protein
MRSLSRSAEFDEFAIARAGAGAVVLPDSSVYGTVGLAWAFLGGCDGNIVCPMAAPQSLAVQRHANRRRLAARTGLDDKVWRNFNTRAYPG